MPKDVTPAIAAETYRVLKTIHASNICHNDLENFRIRPEIGFCNIFIQQFSRNVYVLDFDAARVVDNTPDGQRLLAEEANKLARLFQIILSGENPRKRFSKEVIRLMA
jgi:serine/threonine protein kinase